MVLALIASILAVLGFVVWSTGNIDQRAAERQTTMISHVIEGRLSRIVHEVASVAISDETMFRTGAAFDDDWINANVGGWLHRYFGHDRTILLSAQDNPVYVMVDGTTAGVNTVRAMLDTLTPLIAHARMLKPAPGAGLPQQPP